MKYLISYDLTLPGQDYKNLISGLQRSGARKVLLSAWVIETSWSAPAIRDWVMKLTDKNDRVLVTEFGQWASSNVLTKIA
jgi:hypothetical protein